MDYIATYVMVWKQIPVQQHINIQKKRIGMCLPDKCYEPYRENCSNAMECLNSNGALNEKTSYMLLSIQQSGMIR